MKTVNYFGVELQVFSDTKYIALDGKNNSYSIYAYSRKPKFGRDKIWSGSTSCKTIYLGCYGRLTKPKKSLMGV